MKYSAGIMSHSFWYLETKSTAEYLADDISKKDLLELSLTENIYQVDSERRARELVNVCYRRLNGFSNELLRYLSYSHLQFLFVEQNSLAFHNPQIQYHKYLPLLSLSFHIRF